MKTKRKPTRRKPKANPISNAQFAEICERVYRETNRKPTKKARKG